MVIEVVEILIEKNLKGKVINSKKLGERKNGNLSTALGLKLDVLPEGHRDVGIRLREQDGLRHPVSFVQTGGAFRWFASDENGGENIQITSKIENRERHAWLRRHPQVPLTAWWPAATWHRIPSEKVALAQKMITKCNIAGKFCICATQMLESIATILSRPAQR